MWPTQGGSIVCDKNCEKIHYIAPNIWCCGAGTAADTEHTTELISSQLALHRLATGKESRLVTAQQLLSQLLFRYQGEISAALVLGGVDLHGPHLYSIHPHGSVDELPFVTMGSGSLAAMSVFESRFKADMTQEEAVLLVHDAIEAGIVNDLGSGSNVDVMIITKGHTQMMRNMDTSHADRKVRAGGRAFLSHSPGSLPPFSSASPVASSLSVAPRRCSRASSFPSRPSQSPWQCPWTPRSECNEKKTLNRAFILACAHVWRMSFRIRFIVERLTEEEPLPEPLFGNVIWHTPSPQLPAAFPRPRSRSMDVPPPTTTPLEATPLSRSVGEEPRAENGGAASPTPPEHDSILFFAGNPEVDVSKGVLRLFRDNKCDSRRTPEGLPAKRSDLVCLLAMPAHYSAAEICRFLRAHVKQVRQMRVLRDQSPDRVALVMRMGSQEAADAFFLEYNGTQFNTIEPECCKGVCVFFLCFSCPNCSFLCSCLSGGRRVSGAARRGIAAPGQSARNAVVPRVFGALRRAGVWYFCDAVQPLVPLHVFGPVELGR